MLLAVLGTFVTSALVMSQWQRFESYAQAQGRPHVLLQTLAGDIERVLHDPQALQVVLENNAMSEFGQVYLIDPTGADVLNRPIPADITMSDPTRSEEMGATPAPAPLILARAIRADNGAQYFMIFRFDWPRHPVWVLFRWFGLTWVLIASLVVSGLVSAWLATIVVRPIKKLVAASDRHGRGEFDARIEQNLLLRRDEIGELSRQLSTSAKQIETLMHRQKDFLRDVSHEVRTPLARLQVAAESVELDPGDDRAVAQIQREVEVIDQLVQDILHLSRLDRVQPSHHFEPVSLTHLLTECIESAEPLASRKQVALKPHFDAEGPLRVRGVSVLLQRAVDNLLTNALRYSPAQSTIEVACQREGSVCCVQIGDEGPGVPSENLQTIFEPFVRLDAARQRETGGFGLGLPLVRRIVELHQGSITACRNHPSGLRLKVWLPLERPLEETV
ncbi:MAG: HAMP domain-containing sensor histidine kinase [Pseudomonadota bacterium]